MGPRLQDLRHDPVLEDRPSQRVLRELAGRANAEKRTEKARVDEVDLRRLDQALPEVGVPGSHPKHHVARLEHREPGARGVVGDPTVRPEGREVDELPRSPRAEADERLERLEIGHVEDLAHVALHVGRQVGREPLGHGDAPVEDGRESTAPQGALPVPGRVREPAELVVAEREERQDARAPGQGLGHTGQQTQVGGAGEDEAARPRPSIDLLLEVRQKGWCPLHLVDHGALRDLGEEPAGVLGGVLAGVGRLERDVPVSRKQGPAEGRLSCLARAGHGHHREPAGQRLHLRPQPARDHVADDGAVRADCQSHLQSAEHRQADVQLVPAHLGPCRRRSRAQSSCCTEA